MRRFYFIRHGETDYNLQKVVQGGGIDSDLNATGIEQGRKFYEAYKHISFHKIYHTGLRRTYQTIQSFDNGRNELISLPGLNEMGWGDLEGKPFNPENHAIFMEMNNLWAAGDVHVRFPGGESPQEVWERAEKAIHEILSENPEGNVLICTHGRTLRIILSMLSGAGLHAMNTFPHDNTGVNILIPPGTSWQIEKINCLKHLEEK